MSNLSKFTLALVFFVSLLTLRGYPGNLDPNGTGKNKAAINKPPFETSMERGRYAQVVSLAESKNLNVDEFYSFLKPDLAWYNGHFYSTFPPGVAILATPFYIVGKLLNASQVSTYFYSIVITVITSLLILKTCKHLKLNETNSLIAVACYVFGSNALTYTVTFSAHPTSAFITVLIFYLFLSIKTKEENSLNFFLIGLIYSINLFIDYPNLLVHLPLLVASFFKKFSLNKHNYETQAILQKGYLWGIASCLLGFSLFVVFNLAIFNNPIFFSNTYSIKFLETAGIKLEDVKLSNDIFKEKNYSARFSLEKLSGGLFTLTFAADRGLFMYFPVFLLAFIPAIYLIFKDKKYKLLLIYVVFILNLAIYGAYDDPWGGWSFGPRYLIASLPLLSILISVSIDYIKKQNQLLLVSVFILLCFSTAVSVLGALTTTAVPPSVEVTGTNTPSNYFSNWNYLNKYGISSFFYNLLLNRIVDKYLFLIGLVSLLLIYYSYLFKSYVNSK